LNISLIIKKYQVFCNGIIPISGSPASAGAPATSNSSPGTPGTSISSAGASGSKGAPGAPGAPGAIGAIGPPGIQGIQGLIGLRGPPVKVSYYNFNLANGGSQAIKIKRETDNGYFMVLIPQINNLPGIITVFLLNNYKNTDMHHVGAIYGRIIEGGIGFDFYQGEGAEIKIWYHHLGERTAHVIAHWWD